MPFPDQGLKYCKRRLRRAALGLALLSSTVVVCFGDGARWIDVPFVRQVRAGCGAAAIAMVMQYWAKHDSRLDAAAADAEHIDRALPAASKGIHGNEMKKYLEAHGFSAFVFNGEPRDLEQHLAKGRPLVVCLGLKGPDGPLHYVVVVGAGEDDVALNDPARGKLLREKRETFLRSWKVTGNWALLAVPRQPS